MSVRFAVPAYPGDTIRIELFAKTGRPRKPRRFVSKPISLSSHMEVGVAL